MEPKLSTNKHGMLTYEAAMAAASEDMARQIAEEIDSEILVTLQAEIKRQEEVLISFFCLVGPSYSAVLGDMALNGMEWAFADTQAPRVLIARWSP